MELATSEQTKITRLYKKGLLLEYFSVGYNILEAIASIIFGSIASSIALIGFGLDSIVESFSGLVLIWRLRQHGKITKEAEERIEKRAVRLVAVTFFILCAYVLSQSVKTLALAEIPAPSLPGIIIAIVSLVLMPVMAWQKIITGKQINSNALMADSTVWLLAGRPDSGTDYRRLPVPGGMGGLARIRQGGRLD